MSNYDVDVLVAAFREYKETEAKSKVVCLEAIRKARDEQYRTNNAAYKRYLSTLRWPSTATLAGPSSRPTTLPA